MKTKILMALPIIVLLCWMAALQFSLSTAEKIVLPVSGYDPRDLLSGHYLRVQVRYPENSPYKDCCGNIRRFYVPEDRARELEAALRSADVKAEMVISLPKNGEPKPVDLLLNGKPWTEFQDARFDSPK